jgi:molecular chaperone DnaK
MGEKASGEERMQIETAVSDLKAALEKDDKATIEAKTAALAEASGSLAQKLYAEQAEQGAAEADGGASGDDVVDAEFEEVDDDESKSA